MLDGCGIDLRAGAVCWDLIGGAGLVFINCGLYGLLVLLDLNQNLINLILLQNTFRSNILFLQFLLSLVLLIYH